MQTDPVKIAWVAALLEGEGCFFASQKKKKDGSIYYAFVIACNMTDADVIERLHEWSCSGTFNGPYLPKAPTHNPEHKRSHVYRWACRKRREAHELMLAILPYMGKRRSERIRQLLDLMEQYPPRHQWNHGTRWGYQKGCRCDKCRRAWADKFIERRRKQGKGPRKPPAKHGTRSKYVKGCRCARCKRAARDYQRMGPKYKRVIPQLPVLTEIVRAASQTAPQ